MKIEKIQPNHFAACLNNERYTTSLEVGKIYRIIEDEDARANDLIRTVDWSGEDYVFSSNRFCLIEVPKSVENPLLTASAA